jgi:hypothetical protein
MSKADLKKQLSEINLAITEFEQMMHTWDKRNADPMIVCSIGIVKFVALAGVVFDNETDYLHFINKCVTQGILMHKEEDDNGSPKHFH